MQHCLQPAPALPPLCPDVNDVQLALPSRPCLVGELKRLRLCWVDKCTEECWLFGV
jgi:hypothetical protein